MHPSVVAAAHHLTQRASPTEEQLATMFVEKLQRRRRELGLCPFSVEEEKFAWTKYLDLKKEKK